MNGLSVEAYRHPDHPGKRLRPKKALSFEEQTTQLANLWGGFMLPGNTTMMDLNPDIPGNTCDNTINTLLLGLP